VRALLVVVLLAATAHADPIVNKLAGASIDIPKTWKVQSQSEQQLAAADPTEEAGLLFVVVDVSDLKKVNDQLDAQLAKTATELKWDAPQQVTQNGLEGVMRKGSATVAKKPSRLVALVLMTPKRKGVIVLGVVQADKLDAHKQELDGIVHSLKAVK
jgi:hypothetical protein